MRESRDFGRMMTPRTLGLLTFASVAWGCGDSLNCANASTRLQTAQPGDVVELGACVLEGAPEVLYMATLSAG